MPGLIVYWSSASENTHRFALKLPFERVRIPVSPKDEIPAVRRPYVLVLPTYCDDDGNGGVAKQVIRFLNDPANRAGIRGVVAGGNTNFGRFFAYAGRIISAKCAVPEIDRFEIMGTSDDVARITARIERLWQTL